MKPTSLPLVVLRQLIENLKDAKNIKQNAITGSKGEALNVEEALRSANEKMPSIFAEGAIAFSSGITVIQSQCYRNPFGETTLYFSIKKDAGFYRGDLVAILPPGFRPKALRTLTVIFHRGTSDEMSGDLWINPDGTIIVYIYRGLDFTGYLDDFTLDCVTYLSN